MFTGAEIEICIKEDCSGEAVLVGHTGNVYKYSCMRCKEEFFIELKDVDFESFGR